MGSGFSRFHEYGLNERLKVRQRIEMTSRRSPELGHWSPIIDAFHEQTHAIYGWTNGIHWHLDPSNGYGLSIFRADPSLTDTVAISLEKETKGSYSVKRVHVEATTKEALTTLALHMDRLQEDIALAVAERGQLDIVMGHHLEARKMIDEHGSKFPDWKNSLSGAQRDDPLMKELIIQYQDEHFAMLRHHQQVVLNSLLRIAKMHGVRYVSVYKRDLITFENVRTTRLPFGKPMSWHLSEIMDLGDGCSNSSQTQVRLHKYLDKDSYGVYDLTATPFRRVAPHVSLNTANFRKIEEVYTGEEPLTLWFAQCGARGEEW